MQKQRIALVVVSCAAITACDGVMRIKGTAPTEPGCLVKLTDAGTGQVANTFMVAGAFEERVFFPGAWRAPGMTISAECGGKTVVSVHNPSFPEVDLGNLEP